VAKKKEMFFVQMSLDTKRGEIRKLEAKAQLREESLRQSELLLEEDSEKFDAFLKENDKKAHAAVKAADRATKHKMDRMADIKKLNQRIQLVQSDMSKLHEQLEDCTKYKHFLRQLTPPDWLAKAEARGASDEMYFTEPQQLLDVFSDLEESNLFLIQNGQETAQALEELRTQASATESHLQRKTDELAGSADSLRSQIDQQGDKVRRLRERAQRHGQDDEQQSLLRALHERIRGVYRTCGFDAETNPSTLYMLTDLEAKLEDLLHAMDQMPEEYVVKAEKMREKERRDRMREGRREQEKELYEEKMKKALERSLQAPKKRTGKQVMWRSQPHSGAFEESDVKDRAAEEEENEDRKYFI
jgi:hypothetical protein